MYNVVIGCNNTYYDMWARTLLRSIQHYAPRVSLYYHNVNPTNTLIKLDQVNYTTGIC